MNNSTFEYLRPTTPIEACRQKARHGKGAVFWAGGTDLISEWQDGNVALEYCIDLSFISNLDYIRCNKKEICIGSLTKVASIEGCSDIDGRIPVLSEAASKLGTPQVRNVATIGGNLCHGSPSADLAVPLLVLGAEAKLLSVSGERWVGLEEFFRGVNEAALQEDELLVEIRVSVPPPVTGFSFLKMGRTIVDIALVNAAVRMTLEDNGIFSDVRIALGAVAPTPMRSKSAEDVFFGASIAKLDNALLEKAGRKAAEETKPITDIRASAEYRRKISEVLVRRGIENVIQKLRGRRV
jgi:carbon-monoxide dehydrogenase medium subunit